MCEKQSRRIKQAYSINIYTFIVLFQEQCVIGPGYLAMKKEHGASLLGAQPRIHIEDYSVL